MKTRKKYFVAHYVTDLFLMDDEYAIFYAESKDAVLKDLEKSLGNHLIFAEVEKATWAQRRYAKQVPFTVAII